MGRLATQRRIFKSNQAAVHSAVEQILSHLDWTIETSDQEHLSASMVELWTEDIEQFVLRYQLQAFFRPAEGHTEVTMEIWEQHRDWTDGECQDKLFQIMTALPKKLMKKQTLSHG